MDYSRKVVGHHSLIAPLLPLLNLIDKREVERTMNDKYIEELLEKVAGILNVDAKAVSQMTLIETIDELTKAFEPRG